MPKYLTLATYGTGASFNSFTCCGVVLLDDKQRLSVIDDARICQSTNSDTRRPCQPYNQDSEHSWPACLAYYYPAITSAIEVMLWPSLLVCLSTGLPRKSWANFRETLGTTNHQYYNLATIRIPVHIPEFVLQWEIPQLWGIRCGRELPA